MFIRRFGPAILFSTECFESFNHVFWLTAIHSNRQAPSQDTCQVFAEQDVVKHIVSSGFWHDPKTHKLHKAGSDISAYMETHPDQRHLIGLPTINHKEIGKF